MALIDDARDLATGIPSSDVPGYHETSGLLGALFVILENAGVAPPTQALEAARQAQAEQLANTGPKPAFDATTAAKLDRLDELLAKLAAQVGGEPAPAEAEAETPPAEKPSGRRS